MHYDDFPGLIYKHEVDNKHFNLKQITITYMFCAKMIHAHIILYLI